MNLRILLIPGCFFIQSCSIKFYDYYPEMSDSRPIVYTNAKGRMDTIIFQSYNRDIYFVTRGGSHYAKANFFLYLNPRDITDTGFLNDKSFANEAYCYHNGKLYISDYIYRSQEALEISEFNVLFPKRMKLNKHYEYKQGDMEKTYIVQGSEMLLLGGQRVKALKIRLETKFTEQTTEEIWFKKGEGIVRWKKKSGEVWERI